MPRTPARLPLPLIIAAGTLLGLALGTFIYWQRPGWFDFRSSASALTARQVAATQWAPVIGAAVPNFTLTTARTENPMTLSALRGQPVVLNFWATWCGPCRVEMPAFEAAYRENQPRTLTVMAINYAEPRQLVLDFGDELGLSFPLLLDPDGSVHELYQIRGYPSTMFIAPDGTLAAAHIGLLTEGQLAKNLALILP
jgi:peroxiredoxin